jgi:hypothetical protein
MLRPPLASLGTATKAIDRMAELKRLGEECLTLEEQAGLSQAMERAREGRFIPLGVMDKAASPDEYFADEHDHFRDEARNAYFSVKDCALRKKLIAAQRKIESHIRQSFEVDVAAATRAVSVAKAKTNDQPWTKGAVIAI